MSVRALGVLVIWLAAATSLAANPVEPIDRRDLLPEHARWQIYPSDVRSIAIDKDGRPWFELDGFPPESEIKWQVERAFTAKTPWVHGARIMLFDSAGRIWLCPSIDRILAYNPRTGNWIEHDGTRAIFPGQRPPGISHFISGPAIEDRDGRIFIADNSGCHVFDHGVWTYHPFYELNLTSTKFKNTSREFGKPCLAMDEQGRVFAWTPWDGMAGTVGFWLHDRDGWRQLMSDGGPSAGRLNAVIPLRRSRAILCLAHGPAELARIESEKRDDGPELARDIELLAAESFADRRDAQRRIIERGRKVISTVKHALADAQSPEARARLDYILQKLEQSEVEPQVDGYQLNDLRLCGHDSAGNAITYAESARTPSHAAVAASYWRISPEGQVVQVSAEISGLAPTSVLGDSRGRLFLQHSWLSFDLLENGKLSHLSEDMDGIEEGFLGEDHAGRVFVRSRTNVIAVDPSAPDTRPALQVAYDEIDRATACSDSRGRMIIKRTGLNHPFLSVFENGAWTDLPVPGGGGPLLMCSFVQPLRDGQMVAQEQPGARAFFFDGKSWSAYNGIRKLVEKNYDTLANRIDDGLRGVDGYSRLRVDTRKRVWLVEWDHLDVYDGKRWISFPAAGAQQPQLVPIAHFLPVFGRQLMLLSHGATALLAHIDGDSIKTVPYPAARIFGRADFGNPLDLQIDSGGRAFLPETENSCLVFSADQFDLVRDSGSPRFEDARRRIWYANPIAKKMVVLSPDGSRLELHDDGIYDLSSVVQEKDGSYWINTHRGLLHVVEADGVLVRRGPVYERRIPKQSCFGLWLDRVRILWYSTGARLYRIQLP